MDIVQGRSANQRSRRRKVLHCTTATERTDDRIVSFIYQSPFQHADRHMYVCMYARWMSSTKAQDSLVGRARRWPQADSLSCDPVCHNTRSMQINQDVSVCNLTKCHCCTNRDGSMVSYVSIGSVDLFSMQQLSPPRKLTQPVAESSDATLPSTSSDHAPTPTANKSTDPDQHANTSATSTSTTLASSAALEPFPPIATVSAAATTTTTTAAAMTAGITAAELSDAINGHEGDFTGFVALPPIACPNYTCTLT